MLFRVSVGAPPGTSATTTAGSSRRQLDGGPTAVVLLDEAEKAHSDVFDVFLQVLEDGRLTDSKGRLVDFSHAYVILTMLEIPVVSSRVLNRLDRVLVGDKLEKESLVSMKPVHLEALSETASEEHGLLIQMSDDAACCRRL